MKLVIFPRYALFSTGSLSANDVTVKNAPLATLVPFRNIDVELFVYVPVPTAAELTFSL